tara:strand:+ start:1180 stop:1425 length:246 start_codon:yes stop_codon:yes gene_type:complete
MAVEVFDKVKIKTGTKVYSPERPTGKVTVTPYEVQVHLVLSEDESPDGFGEVVYWRTPGHYEDEELSWAPSIGVIITVPRG